MKHYKLLGLITFFIFISFSPPHKFYVSVTEIEHNQKSQSLQIISRVFIDDLENVLRKRYNDKIRLGRDYETPGVQEVFSKYLEHKMKIELDQKSGDVKYIGREYENDMIVFYLEVENVNDFQNIKVMNTILMDLFEDQKNLVHVEIKGKTKSLILARGKEEDILKF
ncbi:MAG TPA: DUF6702 family protein [Gillisia sp.]|nr:DUF6702 family protein [Gillisia sp.]